MDKNIVKLIIKERQAGIERFSLVERPMAFSTNMNYVLVGIRRSGKSCLMIQDMQNLIKSKKKTKEDFLYINFEDERISDIKAHELGLILDSYREMYDNPNPYIYLDEIQIVEGWEKFVRRLTDQQYRVMVTGSNAKMLSSEIATTLGGRCIIREVFPFSFAEYLKFSGVSLEKNWEYDPDSRISVFKKMETYFYNGGFAETFNIDDKREWINGLYQKIILGDIITRNAIRGDRSIKLLIKKIADSVMQPYQLTKLRNLVISTGENISMPTVKDYLDYMESAYLVFSISNFASSFSEQETIKKRYFFDNGLLNIFLYNGETKLLENIVAIYLRTKYKDDDAHVYFYNKNVEVDFVIPQDKIAIQVSYSLDEADTREREVRALVRFNKFMELKKAVIVTYNHEETIESEGLTIDVVPVWRFLLDSWL
ncbi:MAG: ATP-binding protein [Bacteroidales bacterium]|nr:ATP-binding protein [Bacteroidales bacterium]